MILPTKYIPLAETHLGIGAQILAALRGGPLPVHALWQRMRHNVNVGTFDRMALALDLLFLLGIVEMRDGKIRKA